MKKVTILHSFSNPSIFDFCRAKFSFVRLSSVVNFSSFPDKLLRSCLCLPSSLANSLLSFFEFDGVSVMLDNSSLISLLHLQSWNTVKYFVEDSRFFSLREISNVVSLNTPTLGISPDFL